MKKYIHPGLILSAILLLLSCKENKMIERNPISFFVGTYTQGESEGIYKYELSTDGRLKQFGLMAKTENPSFLAKSADGNYLLAVNEVSNEDEVGYVSSFRIHEDSLEFINRRSSGGAHPCHITGNDQNFIVCANYTGGNIGLLKLDDQGRLSELLDVQQHHGRGTAERQEGPHAHSAWFASDSSLISVDLGTNQLWFSKIDPETKRFVPGQPPTLSMPPGAGPRHLTFHPDKPWFYVINELTSSVSLVQKDVTSGEYTILQTISTLPANFKEPNTCADIHISKDGKFLYASNRGHDSIAIFSVDVSSGKLAAIHHESTRGRQPRNFTLTPDGDYLLVANQQTGNIVSFHRDPETGLLTFIGETQAPTPVCLLF